MKKILIVSFLISNFLTAFAQTGIRGVVRNDYSGEGISNAVVLLKKQNITVVTNQEGEFVIENASEGSDILEIEYPDYVAKPIQVVVSNNRVSNIGIVKMKEAKNVALENIQEISSSATLESASSSVDDNDTPAMRGSTLSSKGDVYASAASYSFSSMRFSVRGYDDAYETTYINGVNFNSLERGGFSYSMLGGLNDAMRNKEIVQGLSPNSFSFGNLSSVTNINTRANDYAPGLKSSLALTNRSYKVRGQVTYAMNLPENDLSLVFSGVLRWADEGLVEGTFYNSGGLFFSLEQKIDDNQSISFVSFVAPTERGQQGAVVQEVYDLAGSIYYNPYWGYQNGEKRNSRVVKNVDPTMVLSYDWDISDTQKFKAGIGAHYSFYSTSALNYYNAPDPSPVYYRYLPSFQTDAEIQEEITSLWKTDPTVSQIDWDALYRANYAQNVADQENNETSSAKYIVERRHNDVIEATFNSSYINQLSSALKLTAGLEAKYNKDRHYKTLDDLLGGKQWIDIDQFAERDYALDANIIQNDLRNPYRIIHEGDIFGYDYNMNILNASAFAQNEWILSSFDVFYALKVAYTQFCREGFMENGRADAVGAQSYGVGNLWYFVDPSFKAGAAYNINGRNKINFNAVAETRAPLVANSYVSPRIKDELVPNLKAEKVLSYDLGYTFTFPKLKGRISVFQTRINDAVETMGYYDDEYRTYVNYSLSGLDKLYQGIEVGTSVKLPEGFGLSFAGTYADYRYTSDAQGVMNAENGSFEDVAETVKTKDLKISAGPQLAANFTIDYMHPKMWFADISINYYDNNYLDFSPNRFRESNVAKYTTPEMVAAFGTQEKLPAGFMLDASIGKLLYLKNSQSLSINLSLNNVLNNKKMITGGYQQARLPLDTSDQIDATALNRFANKYYYASGFNFFLNIGFKF